MASTGMWAKILEKNGVLRQRQTAPQTHSHHPKGGSTGAIPSIKTTQKWNAANPLFPAWLSM